MAFDVKKFLKDELGFTDQAKIDAMAANFDDASADRLGEGYTPAAARADLKTRQTELETRQRELEAKDAQLASEMSEWSQLTATERKAANALKVERDEMERRVLEMRQTITDLATTHGVDLKTVLKDEPVRVTTTKVEAPDMTGFARREDVQPVLSYQFDLGPALMFIADQHYELTGKRLDPRMVSAEIKKRASKKGVSMADLEPVKVWEDMFGIPAVREQKSAEQRAAEIKNAEDRGYERARTEEAIPSQMPGRHSIVFQKGSERGAGPRVSHLQRPQPGARLSGAVAALRTHKYRQDAKA